MALILRNSTKEEVSALFAAKMTSVQFAALAVRLDPIRVVSSTEDLLRRPRRHRRAAHKWDKHTVGRWLINGWSTEHLLEVNRASLAGDSLRHSLHWAFPQAYYSVFALTLAYFKATGLPEESHKAVIKKFGQQVMEARYPESLSFAATNARPIEFMGLSSTTLHHSIAFDPNNPATVDGQVAQFLNATRLLDLKAGKYESKLKTKTGTNRRAFRAEDWRQVADKLGPTSLLSLLYRKRIKANYKDIDTFLNDEIEPTSLYDNLLCVVGAVNFVHEVLIAKAVGGSFLEEELRRLPLNIRDRVERRLLDIQRLAA